MYLPPVQGHKIFLLYEIAKKHLILFINNNKIIVSEFRIGAILFPRISFFKTLQIQIWKSIYFPELSNYPLYISMCSQ